MEQIGPYRVVNEIARGGMGVVYRAQDASGRDVALKLLLAQRQANPNARRRFELEVRSLARLQHPNVVPILGAGEHAGAPWLALEFVAGETLEARLRGGPLPIWEAIRIASQLAQALSYVHGCGVLHRDLKPANVLLREGQALLTDFGISRDDDASMSRITATGVFLGTPGYWAPEQAQGAKHLIGPPTDVYGLGAVLYACLTGQPPVQAESFQDYLRTRQFQQTTAPRSARPEVPEWLSALCMRCLAIVPSSRPATADEVARALVMASSGGAPSVLAPERRTWPFMLAAGLVLGVALPAGLKWVLSSGDVDVASTSPTHEAPATNAEPESPALAALDPPPPPLETAGSTAGAVEQVEPSPELQQLLNEAVAAAQGKRLQPALALYNRALELDPLHAQTYEGRGLVHAQLGRQPEALADFDRGLELDPRDASIYINRAAQLMGVGRPDDALADCDRGLALEATRPLGWEIRASANSSLGRLNDAVEDYARAIELRPHPRYLTKRGELLVELGRYAEGVAQLGRAIELQPRDGFLRSLRALAHTQLGQLEQALDDYDRALELDPGDGLVWGNRGATRARLGRHLEAIEDYDRALALDPSLPRIHVNRAVCYANLGRDEEALQDYARALQGNPRDTTAFLNRGQLHAGRERFQEAIADYDRCLAINPRLGPALSNRGLAKSRLGQHREGLADLERSLTLDMSATGIASTRQAIAQVRAQLRETRE